MCLKELFLKLNSALIRKSLPHFFPSYLSQEVVVKEKVNDFLCVLSRWLSGKNSAWQCRRHKRQEFDPWVGKIPWRRRATQSVQFSLLTQLCPTPCNPMNRSTPGLPAHHQLPGFTQTHVHWLGDAIQPSHPMSSPSPPALNLPSIRVFSNESALRIRWPEYWSFSFNISPSNEHPGTDLL